MEFESNHSSKRVGKTFVGFFGMLSLSFGLWVVRILLFYGNNSPFGVITPQLTILEIIVIFMINLSVLAVIALFYNLLRLSFTLRKSEGSATKIFNDVSQVKLNVRNVLELLHSAFQNSTQLSKCFCYLFLLIFISALIVLALLLFPLTNLRLFVEFLFVPVIFILVSLLLLIVSYKKSLSPLEWHYGGANIWPNFALLAPVSYLILYEFFHYSYLCLIFGERQIGLLQTLIWDPGFFLIITFGHIAASRILKALIERRANEKLNKQTGPHKILKSSWGQLLEIIKEMVIPVILFLVPFILLLLISWFILGENVLLHNEFGVYGQVIFALTGFSGCMFSLLFPFLYSSVPWILFNLEDLPIRPIEKTRHGREGIYQANLIRSAYFTFSIIKENSGKIFIGLPLFLVIGFLPVGLKFMMLRMGVEFLNKQTPVNETLNLVVFSNIYIISLSMILAPFIFGLTSPKEIFTISYKNRMKNLFQTISDHLVLLGFGDLGKNITERVFETEVLDYTTPKALYSYYHWIVLPDGKITDVIKNIAVADKQLKAFDHPVEIESGVHFGIYNSNVSKQDGSGSTITVPAVIGNVNHELLMEYLGLESCRMGISVVRDFHFSLKAHDKFRKEKIPSVIAVYSTLNVSLHSNKVNIMVSPRSHIFFPDFMIATGMAVNFYSAYRKHKYSENLIDNEDFNDVNKSTTNPPKVLILGQGKGLYYFIDSFIKNLSSHEKRGISVFNAPKEENGTDLMDDLLVPNWLIFSNDDYYNNYAFEQFNIQVQKMKTLQEKIGSEFSSWIFDANEYTLEDTETLLRNYSTDVISFSQYSDNFTNQRNKKLTYKIPFKFGNPGFFESILSVYKKMKPEIVIIYDIDIDEELKVLKASHDAISKLTKLSDYLPPQILVAGETGETRRSRDLGDILLKYSKTRSEIVQPETRYLFPTSFSFAKKDVKGASSNTLVGDNIVDVMEEPVEKVVRLVDTNLTTQSKQRKWQQSYELKFCISHSSGSLANLTASLSQTPFEEPTKNSGDQQTDERKSSGKNWKLNFINARFLKRNTEDDKKEMPFCFTTFAELVKNDPHSRKGSTYQTESSFVKRVLVSPLQNAGSGFGLDNSRKLLEKCNELRRICNKEPLKIANLVNKNHLKQAPKKIRKKWQEKVQKVLDGEEADLEIINFISTIVSNKAFAVLINHGAGCDETNLDRYSGFASCNCVGASWCPVATYCKHAESSYTGIFGEFSENIAKMKNGYRHLRSAYWDKSFDPYIKNHFWVNKNPDQLTRIGRPKGLAKIVVCATGGSKAGSIAKVLNYINFRSEIDNNEANSEQFLRKRTGYVFNIDFLGDYQCYDDSSSYLEITGKLDRPSNIGGTINRILIRPSTYPRKWLEYARDLIEFLKASEKVEINWELIDEERLIERNIILIDSGKEPNCTREDTLSCPINQLWTSMS